MKSIQSLLFLRTKLKQIYTSPSSTRKENDLKIFRKQKKQLSMFQEGLLLVQVCNWLPKKTLKICAKYGRETKEGPAMGLQCFIAI